MRATSHGIKRSIIVNYQSKTKINCKNQSKTNCGRLDYSTRTSQAKHALHQHFLLRSTLHCGTGKAGTGSATHFDTAAVGAASQRFESTGEAGTVFLISACKALEAHWNEQSGNHVQFQSYLMSKDVECIPLARFVGNRFNIIFYNATAIHTLREHTQRFYKDAFGTPNRGLFWPTSKLTAASQLAGPFELPAS